jgi:hypothetical protein
MFGTIDSWAFMVGITMLAFIYLGERFNRGAYLWLAALFAIIFALRMATPIFYIASAGVISVLVYRTFTNEDVRENEKEKE